MPPLLPRHRKHPLAIDAPLPEGPLARVATIAGLVIGGMVAISVPLFLALLLLGVLRGE